MGAMKMKIRSRHYRTAAEKAELVAAYHRSGLSQRDFSLQHGIASSNLQRWVRQHEQPARRQQSAALVEVPNLLANRPSAGAYRFHFPDGLELELARGFDVEEVRALVLLLQNL